MKRISQSLLHVAGFCLALLATAPALAQITNVTDGSTSTTTCTSYTFSATGVLTFSPAGCLLASPPPPATPVYSFSAASSSVVETTPTATITVRRSGSDLTTAGSVRVAVAGGSAVLGANYNLFVPPWDPPTMSYTISFAASAAGVTLAEQTYLVGTVNANQPGGASKTLIFSLSNATGGTLGATASHTLSITSASAPPPASGDVDINGAAIPGSLPTGTYAGQTLVCETFQAAGVPNAGIPGAGGKSPCGGYQIAIANANHPNGAYDCNVGMLNTVTPPATGTGGVTNTINTATMFVFEDLKNGNTYIPGVDLRYPQHQANAFVMKFKTGNAGEFPAIGGSVPPNLLGQYTFGYVAQGNRGESAIRFAAISTKPCDFDYAKFDQANACYKNLNSQGGGALLLQIISGGNPDPGTCGLAPNTTYYLSTRWEDVGGVNNGPARGLISCKPQTGAITGAYCGTSLAIN
jgi:hypothetical protein